MFRHLEPIFGVKDPWAYPPQVLLHLLEWGWRLTEIKGGRSQQLPDLGPLYPDFDDIDTRWNHLIYAFMVENSRIVEVFRRVLHEFRHGERLGVPSPEAETRLRVIEELVYRDLPTPYSVALTSEVRPDTRAIRRNAYYRMFGMEPNHGTEDNKPYPYVKAKVANLEFVATFEQLLREAWVGHTNRNNQNGANPTDESGLRLHVQRLQQMLQSRRGETNINREEFGAVAAMSLLHLIVERVDDALRQGLQATSRSPGEALRMIGERVGLPAHSRSEHYLAMAEPAARVLWEIEHLQNLSGSDMKWLFDETVNAPSGSVVAPHVLEVITRWSAATGRDLKTRPTEIVQVARNGSTPTGQVVAPA